MDSFLTATEYRTLSKRMPGRFVAGGRFSETPAQSRRIGGR
jgi:hypothetical protein